MSPLENILKSKHLFISRVRIEIILLCGELFLMLSGRCDTVNSEIFARLLFREFSISELLACS